MSAAVWYQETPAILERIGPGHAWARLAFCPGCYRYVRFCAIYPPIYPSLHRADCPRPPRAPVELRIGRIRAGRLEEVSDPLHFAAGPMEGHYQDPGTSPAAHRERA